MHVLVTGATGFVGRALCRTLLSAGHRITAVSRAPKRAAGVLPGVDQVLSWDQLAEPGVMNTVDGVVHLAGETVTGRWSEAKRRRVRDSRIEGTRTVVDAILAAEAAPGVLVSASGIGFYGDGGEMSLGEDAPAGTDYFAQLCVDWEAEAGRAQSAGCRVVLARLGIVLGLDGGAVGAMLGPARLGLGGPLGNGRQWWSWIHLEDVAAALMHALTTPDLAGPVNMVAPAPIRQRDFASALGVALARPAFAPAPALALRLVLGTFAEEVLASKRVAPVRLLDTGFAHRFPGIGPALSQVLGPPRQPSIWLPLIGVLTLGLAPFTPEPHILGKLRWVLGGAEEMAPVDWLDLAMHGAPWLWLVLVLALRGGATWTRSGAGPPSSTGR